MILFAAKSAMKKCGSPTCESCFFLLFFPTSFLCLSDICFSLPQCGHVFCERCLENWFSTTLVQHLVTHPTFDPNPIIPGHLAGLFAQVRQNPGHPYLQLQLNAELAYFRVAQDLPPLPVYTCPLCRKTVENKPIEDFALKRIVETIAHLTGETAPEAGSHGLGATPWDEYFTSSL